MAESIPKHTFRPYILIAAFAVTAMLPAYFNGVPSGNDQTQHYQFAWTVYQSITSGDLYPSVAGDTNHGFGDVGLRFYPPAAYYVLNFLFLLIRDWYFASLAAFTLVFFAGGVGVFKWTREVFGDEPGLIAAAVYTFAPYHLNLLYNNALMAEFFATATLPFCFMSIARVCRDQRWSDVFALAAIYALLILTHLPMAIIGSLAMLVYGLFLLRPPAVIRQLGMLAAAISTAFVLAAFYLGRMLPELEWLKHSTSKYFSTTWDYHSNFLLYPGHFLNFGEDALNLWLADVMLIVTVLLCLPALIALLRGRIAMSRNMIALCALVALAVFMTTALSLPVWYNAGFLQKVQFPWRWMSVVTAFGSVLASVGICSASERLRSVTGTLTAAGLGFVFLAFMLTDVLIVKGPVYLSRSELNGQISAIPDSNGCECWWPVWGELPALAQTEKVISPGRHAELIQWTPADKQFTVTAGGPVKVTVATFFYPHWRALVNDQDVQVEKTENGAISLSIPAEPSDVKLSFREPPYVRTAYAASLTAWLVVLSLWAALKFRREKTAVNGPL